MGKNVFIPMTRMNLLGCLDSLILAPPEFLKRRKYYEDFTGRFPMHIAAFACPVLDQVAGNFLRRAHVLLSQFRRHSQTRRVDDRPHLQGCQTGGHSSGRAIAARIDDQPEEFGQ